MRTVGRYVVEALEAAGVRHVFGIPGIHNLELYRGLEGSALRHITGRHEQGLGFMADGYARLARQPGVCFTISGPGVTNIATALGQAYADSIPLLVISSQNRRGEAGSGRGFLHELPDQCALARGVTAESFAIREPSELCEAMSQAFTRFAGGRPRPVYVEIPLDVLAADTTGVALPTVRASVPRISGAELEATAAALRGAARPVLLAGGGALGAASQLRRLAERLGAPLVMTTNGRGLLPPEHPLAVGASPSLDPVRELIAAADLVLAVGTEIGPTDYDMYSRSEFPAPAQLIRIDIDRQQLTRNLAPTRGLLGDAAQTLRELLAQELGAPRAHGAPSARRVRERARAGLSTLMQRHLALLDLMRDALPEALLVGDSTQLVYAGNLGFAAATPGSWFNSATGYGTLGYALPASTGAGLAAPERPVICLVGDGGLQFSLGELAVLRDVNAWTAIVVWNNHGYGEIRTAMIEAGIRPEGVAVEPPRFDTLAAAYGYPHRLIETPDELRSALVEFGRRRQIVVLEIVAPRFE